MVGVETVEQLEEALAYERATAAERDYASVLAGAPKHAYMGQCTYCGHCAPCTVGINIALSNKFADLAEMAGEVPRLGGGPLQGHGRHGRRLHRLRRLRAPLSLRRAHHRAHGSRREAVRLLNEPVSFGVFCIRAG